MDELKYKIEDIFNLKDLKRLMHALAQAFEVGLDVRTLAGEKVIPTASFCNFCEHVIRKSKNGKEVCAYSNHKTVVEGSSMDKPYVRQCPLSGLTEAGVKISIDGVHIASIVVEQIRLEGKEPTEDEYREKAKKLGIDEEFYLREIRKIPLKNQKKVDNILTALMVIADQLSELGYNNLHQKDVIGNLENQGVALQKIVEKDALTGLWNRRKIENEMNGYAERKDRQISLISGDANNLKLMNDTFGHEAGDKMLQAIGEIMKELAQDNWIVARCGGDEYQVILPDAPLAEAEAYCERVSQRCRDAKKLNLPLSIALGAAEWNPETETLQECFQRADNLMYEHKKEIKRKENLMDYILERLYERKFLYRNVVEATMRTAYAFALHLGFDEESAERIKLAAKYEDIGMIQLPPHFNLDEKYWTEEERKLFREHVNKSYNIVLSFENTHKIAEIISTVHETWDGRGYPKHLEGSKIPLEARLIRVVDNYCYWTNEKAAGTYLSREDAIERLRRDAGTLYDPYLVEWFIRYLDE